MAVPATAGRTGGPVHPASADGALGAVPVDHRRGHRERVAVLDGGGTGGVVFKRLEGRYEASVRGRRTHKVHETTEAIAGAVTGPLTEPRTLLPRRYDAAGRPRYTRRTTTLAQAAGRALAGLPARAGDEHPWTGRTFSAGWGTRKTPSVSLVRPERVAEVGVGIARDSTGRWRHQARRYRTRPDLSPRRHRALRPRRTACRTRQPQAAVVHAHVDTRPGRWKGAPDER